MHDRASDDADWTLRPRVALTHIPPANDADDRRETLAGASPAARRATDAITWQANADHYPGHLLHDVKRWFAGYLTRAGVGATYDFAAVAVAAYLLGRRDGALLAEEARPAGGAGALAFALAWAGGFACCLLLGLGGFILAR